MQLDFRVIQSKNKHKWTEDLRPKTPESLEGSTELHGTFGNDFLDSTPKAEARLQASKSDTK